MWNEKVRSEKWDFCYWRRKLVCALSKVGLRFDWGTWWADLIKKGISSRSRKREGRSKGEVAWTHL